MPTTLDIPDAPDRTMADVLDELGGIPAYRVRMVPTPGTATEADLLSPRGRRCELVDGTLVEKAMGTPESFMASLLIQFLGSYVRTQHLGMVTGPDGLYRMIHGNIREPDCSFTSHARLNRPDTQVSDWCPDFCIEVLSPDNTRAEMARKRREYFPAGCRLVWEIHPRGRILDVYTAADQYTRFDETATIDAGDILPGFTLSLAELFAAFDEIIPRPA
jgi:Uma2 family endonuclease